MLDDLSNRVDGTQSRLSRVSKQMAGFIRKNESECHVDFADIRLPEFVVHCYSHCCSHYIAHRRHPCVMYVSHTDSLDHMSLETYSA